MDDRQFIHSVLGIRFSLYTLVVVLLVSSRCAIGTPINCTTYQSSSSYEVRAQRAWKACLEDTACKDIYDQRRRADFDIFSFLARRIVDSRDPIRDIYCSSDGSVASEENLWQLYLKAAIKSESICDVNHHHVLDEDGMTSYCACDPDKQCGSSGTNLTAIVVLFILISIGLIVLAATTIFKIYASLRAYDQWLRTTREGKTNEKRLLLKRHELFRNTL